MFPFLILVLFDGSSLNYEAPSAKYRIVKSSETGSGNFWKFLSTKSLAKEFQMILSFLGYFENPHSYVKMH